MTMHKGRIFLSIAALLATLPMVSCAPEKAPHHKHGHMVSKQIYHFADGRSGFRDDDNTWWYYVAAQNNTLSNNSTSSNTARSSSFPVAPSTSTSVAATPSVAATVSAPATVSERGGFGSSAQVYGMQGGQWSKGPAPTENELATAEVTTETIEVSPEGVPMTDETEQALETEVETPTEAAAEEAPGTSSEPVPSEASSESSASSGGESSSSDSGGGSDGGGGD